MAPSKGSPPAAFMRTSNDVISHSLNSDGSPYATPGRSSRYSSNLYTLLGASSTTPSSDDHSAWRSMYMKREAVYKAERDHWDEVRGQLMTDISDLTNRLVVAETKLRAFEMAQKENNSLGDVKRSATGMSSTSHSRTSSNNENRVPSLSSPTSSTRRPGRSSDAVANTSKTRSADGSADSGVNSSRPSFGGDSASDGIMPVPTPGTLREQERPFSPPASALPLSPAPPQNLLHAGHTPRVVGSHSAGSSPGQKTPTQAQMTQYDGVDGDPELKGHLSLASDPTQDHGMLGEVCKKLEDISKHPENAVPAAVAANSPDKASSPKSSGQSNESPAPFDGIRLRLKPSMNFGRPFGCG